MASPGFAGESRQDPDDSGLGTNLSASLLEQNGSFNSPQASEATPSIKAFSKVTEGVLTYEERTDPDLPTSELAEEAFVHPEEPLSNSTMLGTTSGESNEPVEASHLDSPAQHSSMFTIGEPVSPKEEMSSAGVTKLVGLEQEHSSRQELKSELAEKECTISDLKEKLKSTIKQKDEVTQKFLVSEQHHEAVIASKNAEIERLKTQVEEYRVHISTLEKSNNKEKEEFEKKIESLKDQLRSKEEEHRREKAELEREIAENRLEISRMETKEQELRRKLAEAKEETATAKLIISENENVKIRAENAALTERLNSMSSTASSCSTSDIQDRQLDTQASCDN